MQTWTITLALDSGEDPMPPNDITFDALKDALEGQSFEVGPIKRGETTIYPRVSVVIEEVMQ